MAATNLVKVQHPDATSVDSGGRRLGYRHVARSARRGVTFGSGSRKVALTWTEHSQNLVRKSFNDAVQNAAAKKYTIEASRCRLILKRGAMSRLCRYRSHPSGVFRRPRVWKFGHIRIWNRDGAVGIIQGPPRPICFPYQEEQQAPLLG